MKKELTRAVCGVLAVLLLLAAAACKKKSEDDNTVTRELMEKCMNSLVDFDLGSFNKNNLCKQEIYKDPDSITAGCKMVSGRIEWSLEEIRINGNIAVARLEVTVPANTDEVCMSAVNDVMAQLSGSSGASPSSLMTAALKKRVSELDMQQTTCEVTMSKIGDKWYITRAEQLLNIISETRTSVAAVYSLLQE